MLNTGELSYFIYHIHASGLCVYWYWDWWAESMKEYLFWLIKSLRFPFDSMNSKCFIRSAQSETIFMSTLMPADWDYSWWHHDLPLWCCARIVCCVRRLSTLRWVQEEIFILFLSARRCQESVSSTALSQFLSWENLQLPLVSQFCPQCPPTSSLQNSQISLLTLLHWTPLPNQLARTSSTANWIGHCQLFQIWINQSLARTPSLGSVIIIIIPDDNSHQFCWDFFLSNLSLESIQNTILRIMESH